MKPLETQDAEIENWDYAMNLSYKENPANPETVKGSQFEQPLFEFSGACAGCGETPISKLITQLVRRQDACCQCYRVFFNIWRQRSFNTLHNQ
jgi:hypothetical protein